ncbi:MAG: tRNA (adenosine(37)-N6)-threonylcarbamoyltransferase complex ATPase subunit type 1 TsaE [Parcubacteria group bacterium]
MKTMKYTITTSPTATRAVGMEFARSLKYGSKIGLIGPLGSGKTTFVKGMVAAFGIPPRKAMSPSFVLVQHLQGPSREVYHADLWRLQSIVSNDFRTFEELINHPGALSIFEWADKLPMSLQNRLTHIVTFTQKDERTRIIHIRTNLQFKQLKRRVPLRVR